MPVSGSLRRLPAFVLALALLGGAATSLAAPPPEREPEAEHEESVVAIQPDREGPARDLLAPLLGERSDGLELRGPSIERDRIKWWLMRGDEARGLLLLIPPTAGQPDDPRSTSFAIQIAWAPEVAPEPAEIALLEAAVESVQARDEGGFYVLLVDTIVERDEATPASPDVAVYGDPDHVRSLWSLKLAGVALLAGLGFAVTLRPRRELG